VASSTRQSRAELTEALASVLANAELRVAEELFIAGASLHASVQLRSALSDPSAEGSAKQSLIEAVFGSKMSKPAIQVLTAIVSKRWSSPRDLADTAEITAVRLVAAIAARSDGTESLLKELFAIQQVLNSDAELELALSSSQATLESKQALLRKIFGSKLSEATTLLLLQSLSSRSSKRTSDVLAGYADLIAEYASESVAEVRVARPISSAQLAKLQTALSNRFGKKLSLNVVVDESVVGGVRVAVGGQVLDATVQSKINHARLQLA
jgi:F-type H+-transporting ATPase subunit delta